MGLVSKAVEYLSSIGLGILAEKAYQYAQEEYPKMVERTNRQYQALWSRVRDAIWVDTTVADFGPLQNSRLLHSDTRIADALTAIGMAKQHAAHTLVVPSREVSGLIPFTDSQRWDVLDFRTMRFFLETYKQLFVTENHVGRLLFWLAWQQQFTFIDAVQFDAEDNDLRPSLKSTSVYTADWRLSILEQFAEILTSDSSSARDMVLKYEAATAGDGNSVWTYMFWFFYTATQSDTFRLASHRARAVNAWTKISDSGSVFTAATESCLTSDLIFANSKGYKTWPMPSSTSADSNEDLKAFTYLVSNYNIRFS
jgi:hypothetical protein